MAHLVGIQVMLKHRSIDVIIRWVSVHETVKEERVKGEAPVGRGGEIFALMVWPFSPVVCWICGRFILVGIVVQKGFIVGPAVRNDCEPGDQRTIKFPLHGGGGDAWNERSDRAVRSSGSARADATCEREVD